MIIICPQCNKEADKPIHRVQWAEKQKMKIYCSRECSALARSKNKKKTKDVYSSKLFIKALCERTGLTRQNAKRLVGAMVSVIREGLDKNEKVYIQGLGTFYYKHIPSKVTKHPITKKPIKSLPKKRIALDVRIKEDAYLVEKPIYKKIQRRGINNNVKLNWDKVFAIRRLHAINPQFNRSIVAEKLGVSNSTICRIVDYTTWKTDNF